MEKRIIVDYKRKTDGHIYSVSYPITTFTSINDDGTGFRFFLANPYLSDKKGNAYDLLD